MCGIFAILNILANAQDLRRKALSLSKCLRHRGPDWSGIYVCDKAILCHERLGIVDPSGGAQPLIDETGTIALTVNGEIYNHKTLRDSLSGTYKFKTGSDCEPILYLYKEHGYKCASMLDGDFCFVLYNTTNGDYMAARDPIGICPLYYGKNPDGSVWFASELKSLKADVEQFELFPPGHFYSPSTGITRYFEPIWRNPSTIPTQSPTLVDLRKALEEAVIKRMMTDVPYGVLLSGGLDSSLVASIACRHAKMRVEDNEKSKAWWPQIHSFSIGLENAPDLRAAEEAAKFLGTIHHTFNFTVQDGLDAIRDVIWHLETYDMTTIRASTPMYFLSRKIKSLGVKMVLSGEGADEIFGGYLYFDKAPNSAEFHAETIRRINNLHYFDCLRANKSTMAWGLEARVPFLDADFLQTAMSFNPEDKIHWDSDKKRRMEKYVLRKAFDTPEDPYLPNSILWRQKEQFSDGVGYGWIDAIKDLAEKEVSDADYAKRSELYPLDTPTSKEAFMQRRTFEELFPEKACRGTVTNWVPTWGSSSDPSGRVQGVHLSSTIAQNN
eukprot:TRINITY_DN7851_c0_g1_i1.p1 TRINITY_DN7851_c0_g1~~TRINITY_DN7851_c0_g1_i1.p1  ORF type:complete len:553 (-),score=134.23 TRINITY_DN7851_c0_g1_i1:2-1660(-)